MGAQLQFTITNQIIKRVDGFKVVGDSKNYLYAEFNFLSAEWDNKIKTALFKKGYTDSVYEVILEDDKCLIPHEVLDSETRMFFVSVFAGSLITANAVKVTFLPSGHWDEAESSKDPTPSIYEQVTGLLHDLEENKVDKAEGKGLSTNDFTDELKQKLDSIEEEAEKNVNPDWNADSGDAQILNKPTTLAGYGVNEVPANLLNGIIPVENLPASVIERMVRVLDDTARFALTTTSVQNGDTVKVESTGRMYLVTDDTKLDSEDGYEEYTAGSASSVPWSGVTDKPTTVSGYGITDTYTKTEEDNFLSSKVDKVSGKGLSDNNYTTEEKQKLAGIETEAEKNVNPDWNANSGDAQILNKPTTVSGYGISDAYTKTETNSLLDDKVDKVSGKGLSTNDYTNADKLIVGSVQGGLNQKVDKVNGKGLSENDFTNALKSKLDEIEAGAEVNVNADWNASSGDAQILNKPTTIAGYGISDAYTKSEINTYSVDNASIHGGFYIDSDGDLCQV